MPTYEYECAGCGLHFERRQAVTETPLTECPACGGGVRRLISGGTGFILKGSRHRQASRDGGCAFEETGRTCCGRDERCGSASCGDE